MFGFELPDVFRLRNVLATIAAVALELTLSTIGGVPFSFGALVVMLVIFLPAAWIIERALRSAAARRAGAEAPTDRVDPERVSSPDVDAPDAG